MSQHTIRRTSAVAAVAVAMAGVGAFAGTAPGQAAPGNCEQWAFSGPTNIKLSTGPMLSFDTPGSSEVNGAFATDGRQDEGSISGGIAPNGFVLLQYKSKTFPDDPPLNLRGDVTPDGGARGTFNAKLNGTWELTTPLKCLTPAAGQSQGSGEREITSDVDAYDNPGGSGNVLGVLRGGQRVAVISCRDDNWCQIVLPEGPGGTAWMWGDFLK